MIIAWKQQHINVSPLELVKHDYQAFHAPMNCVIGLWKVEQWSWKKSLKKDEGFWSFHSYVWHWAIIPWANEMLFQALPLHFRVQIGAELSQEASKERGKRRRRRRGRPWLILLLFLPSGAEAENISHVSFSKIKTNHGPTQKSVKKCPVQKCPVLHFSWVRDKVGRTLSAQVLWIAQRTAADKIAKSFFAR